MTPLVYRYRAWRCLSELPLIVLLTGLVGLGAFFFLQAIVSELRSGGNLVLVLFVGFFFVAGGGFLIGLFLMFATQGEEYVFREASVEWTRGNLFWRTQGSEELSEICSLEVRCSQMPFSQNFEYRVRVEGLEGRVDVGPFHTVQAAQEFAHEASKFYRCPIITVQRPTELEAFGESPPEDSGLSYQFTSDQAKIEIPVPQALRPYYLVQILNGMLWVVLAWLGWREFFFQGAVTPGSEPLVGLGLLLLAGVGVSSSVLGWRALLVPQTLSLSADGLRFRGLRGLLLSQAPGTLKFENGEGLACSVEDKALVVSNGRKVLKIGTCHTEEALNWLKGVVQHHVFAKQA